MSSCRLALRTSIYVRERLVRVKPSLFNMFREILNVVHLISICCILSRSSTSIRCSPTGISNFCDCPPAKSSLVCFCYESVHSGAKGNHFMCLNRLDICMLHDQVIRDKVEAGRWCCCGKSRQLVNGFDC